ncbi:MAG: tetratricopeptide repeat protein [Pyrinomonadaceae bacterium]
MDTKTSQPIEVFCSYSQTDRDVKNGLITQLAPLERSGRIKVWDDSKIVAGDWQSQINEHLNSAKIILLLVSADFLASDYCYKIEMERALERHNNADAYVFPVILRPCLWSESPLKKLQALPARGRPIVNWPDLDEGFLSVAVGILGAVPELLDADIRPISVTRIPRRSPIGFVMRQDTHGRQILEFLTQLLREEALVALCGSGGVGKTTVAAEAAKEMQNAFDRRIAWISPLATADFSFLSLLNEIVTQLGDPGLKQRAAQVDEDLVRQLAQSRPNLVVLDDFEMISSEEQERCLSFLCTLDSVLFVTRVPIHQARQVYLDTMSSPEADELMTRLIGQMRRPLIFETLERNSIIKAADNNPLVLQWVVSQIDLAKEPATVLKQLSMGTGNVPERVFDRSFNLPQLDDDGRAALLALSLFIPSASREALAAVAGYENDLARLDKALDGLAALSLFETTKGHERLMVEGVTREFAKVRLSTSKHVDEFYQRFILYFLRYASMNSKLKQPNLAALELEKDNVLGAMNLLFQLSDQPGSIEKITEAVDFDDMNALLRVQGYWDKPIPSGKLSTRITSETQIARFAHNVALIYQSRRKLTEARQFYERSLKSSTQVGNQSDIAKTLSQLAAIASEEGDLAKAKKLYLESQELMLSLGDKSGLAGIWHNLGMIEEERGDRAEAARLYSKAMNVFEELSPRYTEIARRNLERIESEELSELNPEAMPEAESIDF